MNSKNPNKYPRVTRLVVRAVANKRLTPCLIRTLAENATQDDLRYDIVRVIAGANPKMAKAVQEEAAFFLEEMKP